MQTRRKWKGNVKSLLHFDFAHKGEPNDGLHDELCVESWSRVGNPKWVGVEEDVDAVVVGTPVFGWRCPQFAGAGCFIKGSNSKNIWNLSSEGSYEIEFFVRATDSLGGNIFALRHAAGDLFALGKNTSNQLVLTCTLWGINAIASKACTLNLFHHVVIRISNKTVRVFLDAEQVITQTLTLTSTLEVIEVRLGEFIGQMDEFVFRHSAKEGAPAMPTEPYSAYLDMRVLGGAGNGAFGDITISSGSQQINTYGMITAIASNGTDLTLGVPNSGIYGTFERGNEIMIHFSAAKKTVESELGNYLLRRIVDIRGTVITIDKTILDDFYPINTLATDYYIQVISIPNFNNLTIGASASIVPAQWSTTSGGGIVAFKCKKNLTLQGKIITSGTMADRTDTLHCTNSYVVDRFLVSGGGGVWAAVGGKTTTTASARIGGAHSGAGKSGKGGPRPEMEGSYHVKPGAPLDGYDGDGGGAGYAGGGGAGSAVSSSSLHIAGAAGTNASIATAGDGGHTHGYGTYPEYLNNGGSGSLGGGVHKSGQKMSIVLTNTHTGQTFPSSAVRPGSAGATIVIITNYHVLHQEAVSSGGCGGKGGIYAPNGTTNRGGGGGGGTGFAYIATRRDR